MPDEKFLRTTPTLNCLVNTNWSGRIMSSQVKSVTETKQSIYGVLQSWLPVLSLRRSAKVLNAPGPL